MPVCGGRPGDGHLDDERCRSAGHSEAGQERRDGRLRAAPSPTGSGVCASARLGLDVGSDRQGDGREPVDCLPLGQALPVPRPVGPSDVVYYAVKDDFLKIGYTGQIESRMKSLAPDELLAVEPGGRALEARRHREFAADRVQCTREWFYRSTALDAHIAAVARLHAVPDLAVLLAAASTREERCYLQHLLVSPNINRAPAGGRMCRACHLAAVYRSQATRKGAAPDIRSDADWQYKRIMTGGLSTAVPRWSSGSTCSGCDRR